MLHLCLLATFLLLTSDILPSHALPALHRINRASDGAEARDGLMPNLPSLPGNPLTGGQEGGGAGGGMISQPLAVMGGYSMLVMPMSSMSDMTAMMSQFQQLMGSIPSLPGGK